jgi:hypothetical protein
MKDAGGDGSEVLLLGKHRSKRRHKLEIVRVELTRYFHIACKEGAQPLVLSELDIVSFCVR